MGASLNCKCCTNHHMVDEGEAEEISMRHFDHGYEKKNNMRIKNSFQSRHTKGKSMSGNMFVVWEQSGKPSNEDENWRPSYDSRSYLETSYSELQYEF